MGAGGRVSRRAVIGAAAVAAAGLAGCAGDRGAAPGRSSATSIATTPASAFTRAAASGSDRDIALTALRDEQRVLAIYQATGRSFPRVRPQIEPLVAVQRRHVQTLVDALESDRPPRSAPINLLLTTPDQIVVGAATQAARRRLRDCERVESGTLASMLASMAAAHQVAAVVAAEWADR